MGTDFTERLRRAVAARHTPEGRGFLAAVLEAVSPDDPQAAAEPLARLLADPVGTRSPSLDAWLRLVATTVGADPERILSRREQVGAALAAVSCRPSRTDPAARRRVRDALRVTAEVG